jgi:hypothetical protein
MVNHEIECIFVEIPKTASSSVRAVIGKPNNPHLNICQILRTMDPVKFEEYFKFSFVRNPWDRVVSLYMRQEGLVVRKHMSFEQFVDWIQYSSATCLHPLPHVNQLDWLVDQHGNMMMDYVGRFERLNDDWEVISGKLNITNRLSHINKNNLKDKHYSEYYNERTKNVVADKFRRDIEYFGYEFNAN